MVYRFEVWGGEDGSQEARSVGTFGLGRLREEVNGVGVC